MAGRAAPSRLRIDARMLGDGGTGVSTYARTLVAAAALLAKPCGLLRAAPALAKPARIAAALAPWPRHLRANGADLEGADVFRVAQSHFNLYGRALRLGAPGPPGIMHWSYPVPMMIAGWANLYTIHDLIPLRHPTLTPIAPERHRRLLDALDRVADRFVAVSGAARDDILATMGWAPGRVVDCGQAVVAEAPAGAPPTGLASRAYLLFCGRIEARKNLSRLIEAHARSGVAMPLVIVGPLAEGGEAILAEGHRVDPRMRHIPYVDRPTLLALIAHARALLLPSLAEGFGLPVAEAMTLGTPALISRDRALVETAGGAALIVDESDVAAIADAIVRLAGDDALCAGLSERGRVRAGAFTVARFAERLEAMYAGVER